MLGEHAARVNGVHVRDQQDFLGPGAGETRQHHLADLLGRIDHPVGIGRIGFDHLDLAAQRPESPGYYRCNPVQPLSVAAARFDRNQLLERIKEWRLLLGR